MAGLFFGDEVDFEKRQFSVFFTMFKFREELYQMTDSLAMGSPVSPVVANIFMEDLERNAISTMTDRPRLWLRFVDDTLVFGKRYALQATLDHLNQQNLAIQFTLEVEKVGSCRFSMRILNDKAPISA